MPSGHFRLNVEMVSKFRKSVEKRQNISTSKFRRWFRRRKCLLGGQRNTVNIYIRQYEHSWILKLLVDHYVFCLYTAISRMYIRLQCRIIWMITFWPKTRSSSDPPVVYIRVLRNLLKFFPYLCTRLKNTHSFWIDLFRVSKFKCQTVM